MKFKLFLLLCCVPLFGAKLLNFNVYDRSERVDVMLSFDSAYDGHISQEKKQGFILLTFNGLESTKQEKRSFKSPLIKTMMITPDKNKTLIMFEAPSSTTLSLSRVNDKIGLRIRALDSSKSASALNLAPISMPSENNTTLTKEEITPKKSSLEGFDYINYLLILFALIALLAILWWLKNSLKRKSFNIKDFNIVFQRYLDKHNQFMILDYHNKRYVMIIGSSNTLLDVSLLNEDKGAQESKGKDFDSVFEENKQKIQNLIQKNQGL